MNLPAMAAALGQLLAALDLRPAVIAGHSAGAAIAARMTLDGAASPRALVSFNGAFLPFRGMAGLLFPPMAKVLATSPFAPRLMAWSADRATVRGLMDAMGGADARGQALYRRLFASPAHVAGALGMMAEWSLPPLVRDLPRLRVPLELAVGEADRAVPPGDAREVARRVPTARLHPLPGLGHLAHEQRPDTATVLIRNALTQNASPAT
jgi:magnesium chelatase accessory protein